MSTGKRYQVIRHWHDTERVVFEANKRRTAIRRAEEEECGLSMVAWVEVRATNTGRTIVGSASRHRREARRARYRAQFLTVAYRGVW